MKLEAYENYNETFLSNDIDNFSVWHKTTFNIISHSLSNCFDFFKDKISTVNLESNP